MANIKFCIGFLLLFIGIGSFDSESLVIPVIITALGYLILYKESKKYEA